MFFNEKKDAPVNRWRDVKYGRLVVDNSPEKINTYRTKLTVGEDRVNYLGYCGTLTVELTTVRILFNSIGSTSNAKFMTIDIKYFYLNTPMA